MQLLSDPGASAVLSEDRVYRYRLVRSTGLHSRQLVNFVGLNPSTADEAANDPTVRRLVGFARSYGFGWMVLTNLFAFRSTDPRALWSADCTDPIGPENDHHLVDATREAGRVVLCWGSHGSYMGRGGQVRDLLLRRANPLWVFGVCKNQQPMHPLYLPSECELRPLGAAAKGR